MSIIAFLSNYPMSIIIPVEHMETLRFRKVENHARGLNPGVLGAKAPILTNHP